MGENGECACVIGCLMVGKTTGLWNLGFGTVIGDSVFCIQDPRARSFPAKDLPRLRLGNAFLYPGKVLDFAKR